MAKLILFRHDWMARHDNIEAEFSSLDDLRKIPEIKQNLFEKDGKLKHLFLLSAEPEHIGCLTWSTYISSIYQRFDNSSGNFYFECVAIVSGYPKQSVIDALSILHLAEHHDILVGPPVQ